MHSIKIKPCLVCLPQPSGADRHMDASDALKALIGRKKSEFHSMVAGAKPVAQSSTAAFVRRGDLAKFSSSSVSSASNSKPSRKRPRDDHPPTGGLSTAEYQRQQRVILLRQKAAAAKRVEEEKQKQRQQEQQEAAQKEVAAAAAAVEEAERSAAAASAHTSSSSSSSSSSSASSTVGISTPKQNDAGAASGSSKTSGSLIAEVPTDEKALDHEDATLQGKNMRRIFKRFVDEWAQDLRDRDDEEKRSALGRDEAKRFKECKDNIRPLFKMSRRGELAVDQRVAIRRISHFIHVGEYVKAHDQYILLAIGNAAWPIGVTMVGIHARGGRERIQSNKIAHAMDDERTLKYLTSIKRLLSYAQRKHPSAPSKMVSM